MRGLSAQSPASAGDAQHALVDILGLHHRYERGLGFWVWRRPPDERRLLRETPDLEYIFVFHGDGRLREAALDKIGSMRASPFLIAALAWRLNDWVEPVRAAARACFERNIAKAGPEEIAAAAIVLLDRRVRWRRGGKEARTLENALARPDVVAQLAAIFRAARTGPMARLLALAARAPAIDAHLERLAAEAFQPAVRAIAFKFPIAGQAAWPEGFTWQLTDKYAGCGKWVRRYGERGIAAQRPLEALVADAARDRSAQVRRIAAAALVDHRNTLANLDEILRLLADDDSRAVRERVDFVRRKRALAQ
ncbi:MAG TPA: hypothetical protein VG889_04820 [Rhizomicrobium sp.]|nr:hypothetical protein [Rhizomicrobium sp.]